MAIVKGPMRELALFAGVGGGILGGSLLGWRTVCAVERDAFAASILAADPKKVRQSNLKRLARQCSDKFKIWQHSEFDACVDDAPLWQGTDRASDVLGDWLPTGLDEIAAIGNAQVPIVAAQAYSNLRNSY